jgi:hypothetical protein
MRHVLLVFLLAITAHEAFCQFNKSVTDILSLTAKDSRLVFHIKGISNDGYVYYSFNYNNGQGLSKNFYFRNDSCKFIKYVLKNDQLSDTINEFNKAYTSGGHNRWVDYNNNIEYFIIIQDNDPIFDVLMRPTIYYH